MQDSRMPAGETQPAARPMPDKGVTSGVTDTYGADLKQGFNQVSGDCGQCEMPQPARMGDC